MEFIHKDKKSIVSQREVGKQTESFSHALKAALREDPDVILVGELRDLETIGMALTAAETGHLVFGTLHTSGAPNTQSNHRCFSSRSTRANTSTAFHFFKNGCYPAIAKNKRWSRKSRCF